MVGRYYWSKQSITRNYQWTGGLIPPVLFIIHPHITMTLFTINNKDYSHNELNLIRDFFTDDQWNIIDYALDEYKQSGEVVEVDVKPITKVRDAMYQLLRSAY